MVITAPAHPHLPLPHLAQVHGSRLRLPQVSPADSGEYVCRVESDLGPKEASIVVSVLHGVHSGPSYTPGEVPAGLRGPKPKALPGARKDAVISGRGGHQDAEVSLLPSAACSGSLKLQKTVLTSSSMGFHTELGVRLTWVQI